MLECGNNFKGTINQLCNRCNKIDDEDHRLNHCPLYKDINNCNGNKKTDFSLIYSESITDLRHVIPDIMRVWNLKNANGSMSSE